MWLHCKILLLIVTLIRDLVSEGEWRKVHHFDFDEYWTVYFEAGNPILDYN